MQLIKRSDQKGNSAFHIAALKGNVQCLRELLAMSKQVNLKNEDDQTPLHLAAMSGNIYCFQDLIEADANLLSDDDAEGNTPLHLAAYNGHPEAVRKLIGYGAKVGLKNINNWTALGQ